MKKHTISEWNHFFGIEVMDYDGPFCRLQERRWSAVMDVTEYVDGINECTIRPVDVEKHNRFLFVA